MIDLTAGRAANTHLRRHLMLEVKSALDSPNMTQVEASTLFDGSQTRVSDLLPGRLDKFPLDTLINWLSKLGRWVDLVVFLWGAGL